MKLLQIGQLKNLENTFFINFEKKNHHLTTIFTQ